MGIKKKINKSKDLSVQLRHLFIEWFRKLYVDPVYSFLFLTSWKSHAVLDPSKINKDIRSLELQVSSTTKINSKEGRKVPDLPLPDSQDANCEVIWESLGI